jgi:CRISPR-associated endonuclease/helicase Cas3
MTPSSLEANTTNDHHEVGFMQKYLSLWAKSDPFHPLWCHLLDVAAVCQGLLPRFGGLQQLPDVWVSLLAALHDIGKADPWFQNKDEECASTLRSQGFQLPDRTQMADEGLRKFRHEVRSGEWLLNWLASEQGWSKRGARVVMTAVDGHHGDFSQDKLSYAEPPGQREVWNPLRQALCKLVWDSLLPPPCVVQRFDDASAVGAKLSSLIVLADWVASNDELFDYTKFDRNTTPDKYFAAARLEAESVVKRLELDAPPSVPGTGIPSFQEVWSELPNPPRPVQAKLEELCRNGLFPGLAIIEAPMGEGKTEAAIYLAECWNLRHGRRGSYLALPTQATANQIHERYEKFLQKRRPDLSGSRLVHGMAWLMDNAAPRAKPHTYGGDDNPKAELLAREWFRPARRALLAGEGVGTVDQALLAALHVKFGLLRLLGLSAKTLIIDEVHAYDDYMTTIMERLLAWCKSLKISVILLSATLSCNQKMRLCGAYAGPDQKAEMQTAFAQWPAATTPYPLLTFIPLDGPLRFVPAEAATKRLRPVKLERQAGLLGDSTGTARLAASVVQNGGCACLLANTVRAAQEIFEQLSQLKSNGALPETRLILFHARFRAEQRNQIEKLVTDLFGRDAREKRPSRAILVATQVVEQSLDVDFDVMISQLAPIDLLLQRSGRLWRHDRSERGGAIQPVLHVILPADGSLQFGATEKVYSREILLRTLSLLNARQTFNLPADFRPLIEGCYGREPLPNELIPVGELDAAAQARDEQRAQHVQMAQRHLLPEPKPDVFEMARKSAEENEGEGGTQSYFVAQTRLGDQSRAALVLHDANLFALARTDLDEAKKPRREQRAPPRDQQKKLFLQKVNIPAWWLANAKSRDGDESFFEGQAWLRGHLVMLFRQREWHGYDIKGRGFCINDDKQLGLRRLASALEGEAHEEADAGQTF